MANKPVYHPGVKTPPSGVYDTVGPRGGIKPHAEITHVVGKPMPPTRQPGQGYRLQEAAKHKR